MLRECRTGWADASAAVRKDKADIEITAIVVLKALCDCHSANAERARRCGAPAVLTAALARAVGDASPQPRPPPGTPDMVRPAAQAHSFHRFPADARAHCQIL